MNVERTETIDSRSSGCETNPVSFGVFVVDREKMPY